MDCNFQVTLHCLLYRLALILHVYKSSGNFPILLCIEVMCKDWAYELVVFFNYLYWYIT